MEILKFKGCLAEKGLNITKLADKLGIHRDTLYRKLKNDGDNLTLKEVRLIGQILNLNDDDLIAIFIKRKERGYEPHSSQDYFVLREGR